MNSCKNFSKKYPVVVVILSFALMYGLMKVTSYVPDGPLSLGIMEIIRAVVIFIVAFLFMGKEKVSFSTKGFGYAFNFLRRYLILMTVVAAFTAVFTVLKYVVLGEGEPYRLIGFINMLIMGLCVGVVEEFIFRGLIFGGLLQKLGNTKKGIIISAVISGLLFGALHVLSDALTGGIADIGTATTAVFKILQCAIFGVVLAFVYYKTRNLFAVAAVHSLDDFMLFIATNVGNDAGKNYVSNTNVVLSVIGYTVFTLILVPSLVRCIKTLNPGEVIPFDEDFLPREVEFEKKSKKKKKTKTKK